VTNHGPASDLDDSLMLFRAIWLRALAHAWANEGWRGELCSSSNAMDVLRKAFPALAKSQLADACTLKVVQDAKFAWIGDDWAWPRTSAKGELLRLRVPLRMPKERMEDRTKHAAALADYYWVRPSIFSVNHPPQDHAVQGDLEKEVLWSLACQPASFVGNSSLLSSGVALSGPLAATLAERRARVFNKLGPSDGRLLQGGVTFLEFQVALLSMMAMAWENDAFRDLITNPENFREALGYVHGYKPPWQLEIQLAHDEAARWDEKRSTWTNLSQHELTLVLPTRPESPNDWSVALAAYNATGAQYPFTCCLPA